MQPHFPVGDSGAVKGTLALPFAAPRLSFVRWQEAGRNTCPQAFQSLLLCAPPCQTGGCGQLSFSEVTLKQMFSSILVGSLSEQGYDISKSPLSQNHHFQNMLQCVICHVSDFHVTLMKVISEFMTAFTYQSH